MVEETLDHMSRSTGYSHDHLEPKIFSPIPHPLTPPQVSHKALRDDIMSVVGPIEASLNERLRSSEGALTDQVRALQAAVHNANVAGWSDTQGLQGLTRRLEDLERRAEADGSTMEAALMSLRCD